MQSPHAGRSKIGVIIVDDSALVRRLLKEILSSDPGIEVLAVAPDPLVARELIKQHNPDVLTLDVEMPRMSGLSFLENLMRLRPMPVVMVSSLTQRGADITLEALSLGAVDFVAKPQIDMTAGLEQVSAEVIRKVRAAAGAKLRPPHARAGKSATAGRIAKGGVDLAGAERSPSLRVGTISTTDKLIAIGASTGGTEAIREVLSAMPADAPGTVITQHIPAAFSGPFAARLNRDTPLRVMEAQHGDRVLPGHVYIAPGGRHLSVRRSGTQWHCHLSDEAPVNQHRPSVDVLFDSVARAAGANAVAALLTGMGDDGARGLKQLREAGAWTLAQDEETSVVWGMPGSAVRLGAAEQVLPLDQVAGALLRAARGRALGSERLAALQAGMEKMSK
jgi:two-component system, chemotaxis family, protein-glutamate methylesterase/glutaminase